MKSRNHKGHVRQFRIASQAWYHPAVAAAMKRPEGYDYIQMGFYNPEGGGSGEFKIEWEQLGSNRTSRLIAHDDSWSALALFHDVLAELAKLDSTDPTVEQVAEVLLKCGVADATERFPADGGPRGGPTAEDAERVAQLYRVNFRALEGLRALGREQGEDPTWAQNVEHGVDVDPQPAVDEMLTETVASLGKSLVSYRERLAWFIEILKDDALAEACQDVLAPRHRE